jgi:ribose transport system substrate-binding protein
VKEALPGGGKVMIFVGGVEQNNARLRRQGVIDELLDRTPDPERFDSPSVGTLEGERYTILDTRTDNADHARAKSNAEDTISRYPDLGCMVGLFAYNVPACVEALEGAGKLGEIAVCGFDEQQGTLQGIVDGWVHGTVTQQPYEYGYQSVRILAALARGDRSVLPADGYVDVPVQVVKADNVRAFWDALKERLASGE